MRRPPTSRHRLAPFVERCRATGIALTPQRLAIFRRLVATDFCVAWSALDARRAGFEALVIEDATRGIDAGGSLGKAWADMTGAGVKRIQSADIRV